MVILACLVLVDSTKNMGNVNSGHVHSRISQQIIGLEVWPFFYQLSVTYVIEL